MMLPKMEHAETLTNMVCAYGMEYGPKIDVPATGGGTVKVGIVVARVYV